MFNSKLKQRIAELETAKEKLQRQYDLVHGLLLQRQDEVVALRRELLTLSEQPQSKLPTNFYPDLKDKIQSVVNYNSEGILLVRVAEDIADQVADYLGEIIDPIFYPDSDYDEDKDEDEDEDE